jgi:hypothetical protein
MTRRARRSQRHRARVRAGAVTVGTLLIVGVLAGAVLLVTSSGSGTVTVSRRAAPSAAVTTTTDVSIPAGTQTSVASGPSTTDTTRISSSGTVSAVAAAATAGQSNAPTVSAPNPGTSSTTPTSPKAPATTLATTPAPTTTTVNVAPQWIAFYNDQRRAITVKMAVSLAECIGVMFGNIAPTPGSDPCGEGDALQQQLVALKADCLGKASAGLLPVSACSDLDKPDPNA